MRKLKMRMWVLGLCLVCMPLGARAGEGDERYQRAADNYYSFIKSPDKKAYHSNWEKLIREFRSMAESYPESHKADDAWYMAGKLSLDCHKLSGRSSDLESALFAFAALLEKYPESTLADDSRYLRGEAYLRLGDPEAARKEYELVISEYRRGDMARSAHARLSEIDAGKHPARQKPEKAEIKASPPIEPPEPEPAKDDEVILERKQPDAAAKAPTQSPVPMEAPPGGGYIRHLRYFSGPDYTRVVIDLDKGISSLPPHLLRSDPELGTPPRLYVDFPGAVLGKELMAETTRKDTFYEVPISDGLLKRARAGQYQNDMVRVVLDIERIDRYSVFTLPGEEGTTRRYVMDVFGSPQRGSASKSTPPPVMSPPERPKGAVTATPPVRDAAPSPGRGRAPIIVIDAGHGGKDSGAVGPRGTREKEIALNISLRLKRELERDIPGARVILTRSSDVYLTLVERTAKANAANADIFLSVHCNASPSSKAYGIETYYLDNTTDRAALKLAARENFVSEQVMVDSGDYTNQILADLTNASKVEESIPLAWSIQKSMTQQLGKKYGSVRDLGVKKAPFWVLTGATMACVLIETSFISNYNEEKRLSSSSYQDALAKSISDGVKNYLREYPLLSLAAN